MFKVFFFGFESALIPYLDKNIKWGNMYSLSRNFLPPRGTNNHITFLHPFTESIR